MLTRIHFPAMNQPAKRNDDQPRRLLLRNLATNIDVLSEDELETVRGARTTCSGGCADDCGRPLK
ncbi:MAG: hypothetical protein VKN56_07560 [Cyanobacteriota bacterium]|nr:hypothetical protein [Cyanobacteriota bacterium]